MKKLNRETLVVPAGHGHDVCINFSRCDMNLNWFPQQQGRVVTLKVHIDGLTAVHES
jgi:hypothetical protein